MLACGFWILGDSLLFASLLLGCFALANLVGTVMWAKRNRLDPYHAFQILLVVILVFTTMALESADYIGVLRKFDPRFENPKLLYFLLLAFPGLRILFHLQNKSKSPETGS